MILTDVLRMPIFKSAALLTSPEIARERQVSSISVIEVPVDKFIRPGELAMSTGMTVGKNRKSLEAFVRQVSQAGASALTIAIGQYTPEIPKVIVDIANRIKLPLITLPWEVRFSEVLESVLKQLIEEANRIKSRDDFVWSIVSRNISEEAAATRGRQFGFEIGRPSVGVVGKLSNAAGESKSDVQHARFVERICAQVAIHNRLQWVGTIIENSVLGYFQSSRPKLRIEPLLEEIRDATNGRCKVSWGIGRISNGFEDLARSYEDARTNCDLGIYMRGEGVVTDESTILTDRVLLGVLREARATKLMNRYIAPLSRLSRVPLLHTLEAFFDAECNASEAARELAISRQSLFYRLRKIETTLNVDLHNPDHRFSILFSLRLHKLQQYASQRA